MLSRLRLSFCAVSAVIVRMIQILTTRIRFIKCDIRYKTIKYEYIRYSSNNNKNNKKKKNTKVQMANVLFHSRAIFIIFLA